VSPVVKWAAVSAATLLTVELALIALDDSTYTSTYRQARQGTAGVVPLMCAGVVLAHLEGWIPQRFDPFYWAGRSWT